MKSALHDAVLKSWLLHQPRLRRASRRLDKLRRYTIDTRKWTFGCGPASGARVNARVAPQ